MPQLKALQKIAPDHPSMGSEASCITGGNHRSPEPKPFDRDGKKAHFRPSINHAVPDGGDHGWGRPLEGRVAEEQAYRRGYHQGFVEAKRLVDENLVSSVEDRELEIQRWRFSRVWFQATMPGQIEDWQITVKAIRYVSPKLRWEILERDGFHCLACGDDAQSGACLEVDHIVPIAKGGSNSPENLQTLCRACNAGKGAKDPPSI